MTPLLCDFLDTICDELANPEGLTNLACRAAFGCSPLIVRGSWFGDDKTLNERHAPFIAFFASDTPAEIEVHRNTGVGAAPRSFGITLAIGTAAIEPVEPPPEIDPANASPVIYRAGGEAETEHFVYTVLNAVTNRVNQHGYFPQEVTLNYSTSDAWPLIVHEINLTFATAARVLHSGIC